MKKAFLLLLCCGLFAACKKDDSKTVDTGSVRFTNNSLNPYTIYLDGSQLGDQNAKTYTVIQDVAVGSHIAKAVQKSGYALYPTIRELNITVSKGQEVEFVYP